MSSVTTHDKLEPTKVGKYFRAYEFDCPCDNCDRTLIDMDLVSRLDSLRDSLGCSVKITSGYRCPSYQAVLKAKGYDTAKTVSQHTLGRAADVTTGIHTGKELEEHARQVGFLAVGVGKTFVHLDMRPEKHSWTYNY